MNIIDISKVINEDEKTVCFTGHRPKGLAEGTRH